MADGAFTFDLTPIERIAVIRQDYATFLPVMFAELNSGSQLVWDSYLNLICSRLQDIAHGARKNLIITMPPRHLKSFCVSVALPAFVLGHYPGQEILCVSYGQDLAKEFAAGSLRIMQSQPYVGAFGRQLRTAREPLAALRIRSAGCGAPPRSRAWRPGSAGTC